MFDNIQNHTRKLINQHMFLETLLSLTTFFSNGVWKFDFQEWLPSLWSTFGYLAVFPSLLQGHFFAPKHILHYRWCNPNEWSKKQDSLMAPSYFCPITKFSINFCKQIKNEKIVSCPVFKGFPQTSIPPLISTIHGIIDSSGLHSKVLNPR